MQDQGTEIAIEQTCVPAVRTTTVTGSAVDLQGFGSATVVVYTGTLTDGTYAIEVQESDASGSGFAAVADADLIDADGDGTIEPTLADTADNTTVKIGYKGTKRYVKAVITLAGITSGGVIGALVVKGHPRKSPK